MSDDRYTAVIVASANWSLCTAQNSEEFN